MCEYKRFYSGKVDSQLYAEVLRDLKFLKKARSTNGLDRILKRFLNMLGFEEFNPYLESRRGIRSIEEFKLESVDDYSVFLTYTHYGLELNSWVMYQTYPSSRNVYKRGVSRDTLIGIMAMFITENSLVNKDDLLYLSDDMKNFYPMFIAPYKKSRRSYNTQLKKTNEREERSVMKEITSREFTLENVAECSCNKCAHCAVCKYVEEVPKITVDSDVFTVEIKCKYFKESSPLLAGNGFSVKRGDK